MNTLVMASLAILVTTPALAGSCDRWNSAVQEEEGGPVMTASICAADRSDDLLLVTCGDDGAFALRFLPMTGNDYPPGGNMDYRAPFIFRSDTLTAEVMLAYEAMDGAMTATPRRDGELVRVLKSAGAMVVTDKSGVLPAVTFTLDGSTKAIAKVESGCQR